MGRISGPNAVVLEANSKPPQHEFQEVNRPRPHAPHVFLEAKKPPLRRVSQAATPPRPTRVSGGPRPTPGDRGRRSPAGFKILNRSLRGQRGAFEISNRGCRASRLGFKILNPPCSEQARGNRWISNFKSADFPAFARNAVDVNLRSHGFRRKLT